MRADHDHEMSVRYVQARDEFEQKVARINKRLIHLIREGEAVRSRMLAVSPVDRAEMTRFIVEEAFRKV